MENLLIYFLKANGLIILFYLMYVVFLRKETFFVSNRWYLIVGLVLSLILPLITFTKTIWVDPIPIQESFEEITPIITTSDATPIQENLIDWSLVATTTYIVISILLVMRITFELVSFFNRIRKHNKKKESEYTLIYSNTTENPFSFFNYVVINPSLFSEIEIQHILTHESIHVKQKHSVDVLFGKLFCALFWVNPIVWLYRKAMLQNLEFIADNATFQQIENKYEYQKTLLKVVTHQHDLSITNQFYQSLIKKRIVMLHTNQSHKRNAWKYATILPLLTGFFFMFQIETVAQVKEVNWTSISSNNSLERIEFIITKNTTDEEINKETYKLKQDYNIELKISKIKRNKENEIIALDAKFEDSDKTSGKISIKGDKPIEPVRFFKEINDKGKGNIGFDRNNTSTVFSNIDSDIIIWKDSVKEKSIEIKKSYNDETIYIINGKEFSKDEMKDKIVELDGAIEMNEDEKSGKKIMIFKGNSTISEDPKTSYKFDQQKTEEIDANNSGWNISYQSGIPSTEKFIEDLVKEQNIDLSKTKIVFNGIEYKKSELNKIEYKDLNKINIIINKSKNKNENDIIILETKNEDLKTFEFKTSKPKPKTIEIKNGDVVVIFDGDKIKFPGYPTQYLNQLKLEFQGKILEDNIDFFKNYELQKIKDIKIIEEESSPKEKKIIKKIIIETK